MTDLQSVPLATWVRRLKQDPNESHKVNQGPGPKQVKWTMLSPRPIQPCPSVLADDLIELCHMLNSKLSLLLFVAASTALLAACKPMSSNTTADGHGDRFEALSDGTLLVCDCSSL